METRNTFLRLAALVVTAGLTVSGPALAQKGNEEQTPAAKKEGTIVKDRVDPSSAAQARLDTSGVVGAQNEPMRAGSPGEVAALGQEVKRARVAGTADLVGSYMPKWAGSRLAPATQVLTDQNVEQNTRRLETRGWWRRNWPYVVVPIAAGVVGGGVWRGTMCRHLPAGSLR